MARATTILSWTARHFGDDITERVFVPLVADWQRERQAAPTVPRRLIRDLSGVAALMTTAAHVATRLSMPWDLPRRDLGAIGVTFVAYAAIGLAIGLVPFAVVPIVSGPLRLAFVAMLAPAMLAVAVPVALLPTAATIERRSRGGWEARAPWLLASLTALSMAALTTHVGWVVPAVNQAFRLQSVSAFSNRVADIPRGVKELTIAELVGDTTPAGAYPQVTGAARREEAALRLTLVSVWPAAFAWFGWCLARRRQPIGGVALAGWWTLAVVTALLVSFGGLSPEPRQLWSVSAAAGAWLFAAAILRRHTAAHSGHDVPALTTPGRSARR